MILASFLYFILIFHIRSRLKSHYIGIQKHFRYYCRNVYLILTKYVSEKVCFTINEQYISTNPLIILKHDIKSARISKESKFNKRKRSE